MIRPFAFLVLALALAACGGTDFAGGGNGGAGKKAGSDGNDGGDETDQANGGEDAGDEGLGSKVDLGAGQGGTDGDEDLGGTGASEIVENGELIQCPKKAQRLLILDFKSGWWAGDGGDFFQKVLDGLHVECKSSVTIEYHHLVKGLGGIILGAGTGTGIQNTSLVVPGGNGPQIGGDTFQTAFGDPTWNAYTQVWILSGSHADSMDLHTSDPFFAEVVSHAKAGTQNLFVGAGFGSITHANAVASAVGLGVSFQTAQEEGRILNPMGGVQVKTTLAVGDKLKKHVLFTRGIKAIADDMDVGGEEARGDFLNVTGATVIGNDSRNQPVIALPKLQGRKAVVDAGLQRYYAIWNDHPDTFQLLKNLIVYLSQ